MREADRVAEGGLQPRRRVGEPPAGLGVGEVEPDHRVAASGQARGDPPERRVGDPRTGAGPEHQAEPLAVDAAGRPQERRGVVDRLRLGERQAQPPRLGGRHPMPSPVISALAVKPKMKNAPQVKNRW